MVPLCILLVLLCEFCLMPLVDMTTGITQDSGIITAEVGQEVTLKCFCQDDTVTFLSWYQQSLGGKPLLISTRMKGNMKAIIYPAYEKRFQVFAQTVNGTNNLIIKDLHLSDSATYYCGFLEFNAIEFGQGAFLHVKKSLSNIQAVVHQPVLEPLRSGESVNLSCTIYAEKCAEEERLYWFRHGGAQPAIVYHSAGQCIHESETKRNCTINLTIKSLNSSHAGMYYCALAFCGETVFGNGTKVEVVGRSTKASPVLVYSLSSALAFSIILLLLLAVVMYKLKKNICSVCKGTVSHLTCSAASDGMSQDADALHYAALSLKRTRERHRQEDSEDSVCVYSRVKSRRQ